MTRLTEAFLLSIVQIDDQQSRPLYQQIYDCLRGAILTQQLRGGVRLPSIRDTAGLLHVSRNTVTNAFDQLIAEGYLETRPGAGTYISEKLPEDLLQTHFSPQASPPNQATGRHQTRRSRLLTGLPSSWASSPAVNPAFKYGLPALDHFPFEVWGRLAARRYRYGPTKYFDYTLMTAGFQPLREAIAEHLRSSRGVRCAADQIIITSGTQQAIFMAAQILLDPGETVLVEEPGYQGAHRAFTIAGATIVPVPIDANGFDSYRGHRLASEARVAFVTPSRQSPTGRMMTLERRLELIDWAERVNGWIIEDDYDSEFHYTKRPLAALQGLDVNGRVIYLGTFSKILFPALRLGYIVAPEDWVDKFVNMRGILDTYTATISQVILADFMEQGHFIRHLRRMRQLYAKRRTIFMTEAAELFEGLLDFEPADAGMSVTAWLPQGISDDAVSQVAAAQGLTLFSVSPCYWGQSKRSGLLFGYAACDEATIKEGLKQVKALITTIG